MKNKGRRQKAGYNSSLEGICNCKGWLVGITRDIRKIRPSYPHLNAYKSNKFLKKKWSKRVRGYFKTNKLKQLEKDEE